MILITMITSILLCWFFANHSQYLFKIMNNHLESWWSWSPSSPASPFRIDLLSTTLGIYSKLSIIILNLGDHDYDYHDHQHLIVLTYYQPLSGSIHNHLGSWWSWSPWSPASYCVDLLSTTLGIYSWAKGVSTLCTHTICLPLYPLWSIINLYCQHYHRYHCHCNIHCHHCHQHHHT